MNQDGGPPLVVIAGATASGKSGLAVRLAQAMNSEVLSCDMLQVFSEFTIGSAKIRPEEQQGVRHHLLDIRSPMERYDAATFRMDALEVLRSFTVRNPSTPLFVAGGSSFYLETLLCGIDELPSSLGDIEELVKSKTPEELYALLQEGDPERALQIHPHDHFRVERAVEIFLATGKTSRELFQKKQQYATDIPRSLIIVLCLERPALYERINARVANMFSAGLVEEVLGLQKNYGNALQGFDAIGYRQVLAGTAQGHTSIEMADLVAQKTRNYAKRQWTYWRNAPRKFSWQTRPGVDEECSVVLRGIESDSSQSSSQQQVGFRCFSWDFKTLLQEVKKEVHRPWSSAQVWYVDGQVLSGT